MFFLVTPRNKEPAQDPSATIPISIHPASVPLPSRFRPASVPLPSASVPLPSRFRPASVRFRPASVRFPSRFPSRFQTASLQLLSCFQLLLALLTVSGLPFAVEYRNTCSPEPFSSAQSFSGGNSLANSAGVFSKCSFSFHRLFAFAHCLTLIGLFFNFSADSDAVPCRPRLLNLKTRCSLTVSVCG